MLNVKEVKDVYWTNDEHTRVSATFVFEDDNTDVMSIAVNPSSEYWNYIAENVPEDVIQRNTDQVKQDARERRRVAEYRKQEQDTQKKHNQLFTAKIEAFDIAAVANSSSARKAKIRKAKSMTEVIAQVAVCIIESEKTETQ